MTHHLSSPTQIGWEASGSPRVPECEDFHGMCWICGGEHRRGHLVTKWVPKTYMGHHTVALPDSPTVCEACVYVHSRTSPVPGRPPAPGKQLGGNWRNYTHMWSESRGYANASKAEPDRVCDFLASISTHEKWYCGVAESGQKHVLPITRMQVGHGGCLRYEEQQVALLDVRDFRALTDIEDLLSAGISKTEIASFTWSLRKLSKSPTLLKLVRRFDSTWRDLKDGPPFQLQLFLSRKKEAK